MPAGGLPDDRRASATWAGLFPHTSSYNSVHLAFVVLKAVTEASMKCPACRSLLHLECLNALKIRVSTADHDE